MRVFLLLLMLLISFSGFSQSEMTGFWHNSPHVGSGLGEYYAFYDNNTFSYATSSMDCDQRLESYSGVYSIEGDTLILKIQKVILLLDGEVIPDETSCYNGFYIEGGETVSVEAKNSIVRKYVIEFFTYTEEELSYKAIKIGERIFYLLSADPSVYITE